ncbi:hypothetical protein DB346_07545 [Verrucomicrobia bacterium LW23]|nr:hypothetical protein DB346_07545 [Verrucomicrobia bacterium LW23]
MTTRELAQALGLDDDEVQPFLQRVEHYVGEGLSMDEAIEEALGQSGQYGLGTIDSRESDLPFIFRRKDGEITNVAIWCPGCASIGAEYGLHVFRLIDEDGDTDFEYNTPTAISILRRES